MKPSSFGLNRCHSQHSVLRHLQSQGLQSSDWTHGPATMASRFSTKRLVCLSRQNFRRFPRNHQSITCSNFLGSCCLADLNLDDAQYMVEHTKWPYLQVETSKGGPKVYNLASWCEETYKQRNWLIASGHLSWLQQLVLLHKFGPREAAKSATESEVVWCVFTVSSLVPTAHSKSNLLV